MTDEAVSKSVDHVEDGVDARNALPERGEDVNRVEHATEINQGEKDEGVEGPNVVKLVRKDRDQGTER